jgi:hypothetical protein
MSDPAAWRGFGVLLGGDRQIAACALSNRPLAYAADINVFTMSRR